jgi:hypothetical protein
MDGQTDGRINRQKDRWTDRTDGQTNRWMDKWTDRQMEGQKDRWAEGQIKDLQMDKWKNIINYPLWGRCFKSNATADWLVYDDSNFYGKKVIRTAKPHENVLPLVLPFPSNNFFYTMLNFVTVGKKVDKVDKVNRVNKVNKGNKVHKVDKVNEIIKGISKPCAAP